MVVCERVFALFLAVIIISSIATTNAYKKHVENSKYIQSDSSEEQLEHLTVDQPENEMNCSIPLTEYGVDVPCKPGFLRYNNVCICGIMIIINQSLPENKPEDQPEDQINRTIPPIEYDVSVPCNEDFIPYNGSCVRGIRIKINQSPPDNKPEYETEDQPKDQAEDEINRTIPPIKCNDKVPCAEGFITHNRNCIPGLIIRIQIISKTNLYKNI